MVKVDSVDDTESSTSSGFSSTTISDSTIIDSSLIDFLGFEVEVLAFEDLLAFMKSNF